MWNNIKIKNPPFPNKGQRFLVYDGIKQHFAYFHIDPINNKPWWEDDYSDELVGITHWKEQEQNPKS